MREYFIRIFNEYNNSKEEDFNLNHPLARFIQYEFPRLIAENFPESKRLLWNASAGKGRWADAPWFAIFDPIITSSAQNGFYPVFLFDFPIKNLYLSMNQGMASLKNEFGAAKARDILKTRALIMAERVKSEYPIMFNNNSIDLKHNGPSTRLAFYEPGHSFGKKYTLNNFPSNDMLYKDINYMLKLYNQIIQRGGVDSLNDDIEYSDFKRLDENITMDEKRRITYHKKIERRNSTLSKKAKEIHGYICQVCGFDYEKKYGALGPYIEAHHKIPLSTLTEGTVSLSPRDDFAVLCANCHRMIHKSDSPEDFDEFVRYYEEINKP